MKQKSQDFYPLLKNRLLEVQSSISKVKYKIRTKIAETIP